LKSHARAVVIVVELVRVHPLLADALGWNDTVLVERAR